MKLRLLADIFGDNFERAFKKIKDRNIKNKIIKQISKIQDNPELGKPMRYARKGTRELYIKPFRLAYAYNKKQIILLELYHKDEQ